MIYILTMFHQSPVYNSDDQSRRKKRIKSTKSLQRLARINTADRLIPGTKRSLDEFEKVETSPRTSHRKGE